jgi:hypothetical protein
MKLWSNTESHPDGLLKRPDRCKLEQFEALRHRGRSGLESSSSGRYDTSSRRLVLWTADRPDGWHGTKFFDLQIVQNLLETPLNSGIPVKEHHYKELILSKRMRPISN